MLCRLAELRDLSLVTSNIQQWIDAYKEGDEDIVTEEAELHTFPGISDISPLSALGLTRLVLHGQPQLRALESSITMLSR